MAMENLSIAQHQDTLRYAHTRGGSYKPKVRQFDVGDFVYLQRQPNDTLDTSSGRTILRIKATRPSGVLELQGADERTICDHSKNCAPCHLPNLDPTIITSTWIPPLDYPCQVCQRMDDVDQMLLCDNCNGVPSLLPQAETHSSSRRQLVLFIMFSYNTLIPTQTMPCFSQFKSGGGYMKISFQPHLCIVYICVHAYFFS
jgi:hypothetical protein